MPAAAAHTESPSAAASAAKCPVSSAAGYESWGLYPRVRAAGAVVPASVDALGDAIADIPAPMLPRGLGRSYGDSCLIEQGILLDTRKLRAVELDSATGVARCEAGASLDQLLAAVVPQGWFPPVLPGTKFVTVGGAIANDIHGKNHHRAGTFGCHVQRLELLRSDGTRLVCSPSDNADWLSATIGGLGLTGCITWADLALRPLTSSHVDVEWQCFEGLERFAALASESAAGFEYRVAWLDAMNLDAGVKGVFFRANHSSSGHASQSLATHRSRALLSVPFRMPNFVTSRPLVARFNRQYYKRHLKADHHCTCHYDKYFFPLDRIGRWNRLFGRGLIEWQCVVPWDHALETMGEILSQLADARTGAAMAVLKVFGDRPSPGSLSFPLPGISLSLTFPYAGAPLMQLLERLDALVTNRGGRIYPAKDSRMHPQAFAASFPAWKEFRRFVDPRFTSAFYRRING